MKTLTVMTPTYNRRDLIKSAYDSLVSQTCSDFVWMIVDDGSSDGTEEVVSSFISEGKIEIEYIKKENGGKHTAVNCAFENVKTELIAVSLDSDDRFTPDAVEKIVAAYKDTNGKYSGYVFLKGDAEGRPHVSVYDDSLDVASWQTAAAEGLFEGEAVIVLKSAYAAQFRFPVFDGEKFCTEGIVWLKMTEPFKWFRDVINVGDYREDGYTKNIRSLFAASPRSFMIYNDLRLSLWRSFPKRFKFAVYYDGFAMACRSRGFIRRSSSKALAVLALPFGLAFRIFLKI